MTELSVPDMTCGHCKASVEAALAPLADQVKVDLASHRVTIQAKVANDVLLKALDEIGFPASVVS